jgi:nucleotide-binding universal stress UspA family protein
VKNILVPIDCSAATPRVLDLARQLAGAFRAELHLVHVREIQSPLPVAPLGYGALGMPEMVPISGVSIPMPQALEQTIPLNDEQQARLAEWQREIARAGVKGTLHEPTGAVLDEILKLADAVNADLIVMGRHGHGAMYNLLVGSVTEGVLKQSARPVLLVPSSGGAKP